MNRPLYIKAAAAISPQHSFDTAQPLQPLVSSDNGRLYVIDADYRQYINPVAIRRMSRLLKMSISAAMKCLKDAGVAVPDAVITGTGRGSLTDTELFVKDLIRLHEEALNPTLFIQSTYNAPNGWIALQTKGTGYNQTYVHRGISLELALIDAQMLIAEDGYNNILVGCFDELTSEYITIKNKLGYWKKDMPNSLALLQHADTPGTIGGEGTAFFTLSGNGDNAACAIRAVQTSLHPSPEAVADMVQQVLAEQGLQFADLDLVLCGMSGDARFQPLYDGLLQQAAATTTIGAFKHLCGEYDTSSGFALWLATQIMAAQHIPEAVVVKKGSNTAISRVLILNHFILNSASAILVTK
jgi:3-oxoacyl-[acyl-carrier-protein] synthase III